MAKKLIMCPYCGTHLMEVTWWQRILHWAGWWP